MLLVMIIVPIYFAFIVLGVWVIRRFTTDLPFRDPTSLTVFFAIAVVLIPVAVIIPESVNVVVSGAENVWTRALRFWLSGALGTLIATPALTLTLAKGISRLDAIRWPRSVEIVGLALCLGAVGYVCFQRPTGPQTSPALLYAPLPLILWAATRFGLVGVCWALLLLGYQSTWGAVHGHGPFTTPSPSDNVLQLQLFLLTISLPLMFLAVLIEDRRRAFAALSQSEQEARGQFAHLATIYNSAPVGLAFVDTQLRIVKLNHRLAEFSGKPANAHIGQTLGQVLPHLADTLEPICRGVIETGKPVIDVEIQGVTEFQPEIERSWLLSYYPVKDPKGPILGVNTVVQDITERKRAEESKQELTHAFRLALVGELTASIAHEINQPLGAILSNADAAEMLLESSRPSLDELRQILGDIRKDDLRASEVIGRLRDLLRKREIEFHPVNLNDLTTEVISMIRTEARRRGVVVEAELASDLPHVQGDKVHLQQVLLNLFLNGMEAMANLPSGKRLKVRTALDKNGCVEIAVSDRGTGILPSWFPRLFDPFFSTRKEGMGLGLSIARSLVEGHGGRIWAENNSGRGATFRFTLPTDLEQKSQGPKQDSIGNRQ
jgi:PAS domain S-box-containing protein